jgi:phospholipid/cholesterol/gamma-HCH transport system substrate-binding protein
MASYRKNLAVGATMLGALILLGLMILLFGEAPVRFFQQSQLRVTFQADSADGVSIGSPIYYLGVNVGQVRQIELPSDAAGVIIRGTIRAQSPVPANVEGVTKSTLIGGSSSLNLEPTGPAQGRIGDGAFIRVRTGGNNVLPPQFAELAKQLTELSKRLQVAVEDWNESKTITKITGAVESFHKTIDKVGQTSEELRKFLADDKMRGDLKDTLANFKQVSQDAKTISKNLEKLSADASVTVTKTNTSIDDLSKQLAGRLDQLAGVFDKLQSVVAKIDKGEGTAAKLINDPKLYESLVDTSQELNLTVKDLRRLVEQWEQEGVSLKLGGKK